MAENKNKRFTANEIDFIKANADKLTVKELAHSLGRTERGVRGKIERLNIKLNALERNEPYQWTKKEEKFIRENYTRLSDAKIAEILKLNESLVCRKRLNMGLKIHHLNEYEQGGYMRKYINGIKRWMHRYNMEQSIGRKLKTYERVHHIDLDKKNNKIENLYLCKDKLKHSSVHWNLNEVSSLLIKNGLIKFDKSTGEYYLSDELRGSNENISSV